MSIDWYRSSTRSEYSCMVTLPIGTEHIATLVASHTTVMLIGVRVESCLDFINSGLSGLVPRLLIVDSL